MSIIKEIIKCNFCKQINQKIEKAEDFYTYVDFHPNLIENKVTFLQDKSERFITQLFDNSVFPWFYENLLSTFWKMGLRGFGGIERESQQVLEFFGKDLEVVMDLSCGTGIMTRNLIKSQFYKYIIDNGLFRIYVGNVKEEIRYRENK